MSLAFAGVASLAGAVFGLALLTLFAMLAIKAAALVVQAIQPSMAGAGGGTVTLPIPMWQPAPARPHRAHRVRRNRPRPAWLRLPTLQETTELLRLLFSKLRALASWLCRPLTRATTRYHVAVTASMPSMEDSRVIAAGFWLSSLAAVACLFTFCAPVLLQAHVATPLLLCAAPGGLAALFVSIHALFTWTLLDPREPAPQGSRCVPAYTLL